VPFDPRDGRSTFLPDWDFLGKHFEKYPLDVNIQSVYTSNSMPRMIADPTKKRFQHENAMEHFKFSMFMHTSLQALYRGGSPGFEICILK
jgi:hypothetical protein